MIAWGEGAATAYHHAAQLIGKERRDLDRLRDLLNRRPGSQAIVERLQDHLRELERALIAEADIEAGQKQRPAIPKTSKQVALVGASNGR